MALTERALDRMEQLAGDAFRRVGSLRLAADEAERDGASARARRAARPTASRSSGWTSCRRGSTGCTAAAIQHPATVRSSPLAGCDASRRTRAAAGAELREHDPVTVDTVDADVVVVAGDGFTASLLPELAAVVRRRAARCS